MITSNVELCRHIAVVLPAILALRYTNTLLLPSGCLLQISSHEFDRLTSPRKTLAAMFANAGSFMYVTLLQ